MPCGFERTNRQTDAILWVVRGLLSALAATGPRAMGFNARNDEIRDNITRMREWETQRGALATVRRFNEYSRPKVIPGSGPRLPRHVVTAKTLEA